MIFSFCIVQKLMPDFALTLRKEAVALKAAAKRTKWLKFPQRRRANFKPRVVFLLMMNGELKIANYGLFYLQVKAAQKLNSGCCLRLQASKIELE